MVSIGEFSKTIGFTIKTLRYYHDLGILIPEKIDGYTGYRYYGENAFNRAAAIMTLKNLGFSLHEIKSILEECSEEEDLSVFIENKIEDVKNKISNLRQIQKQLAHYKKIITVQSAASFSIKEGFFPETLICGVRIKGKYSDIGGCFSTLMKKTGGVSTGKPLGFFYDLEYKEDDADIEGCVMVKKEINAAGINCRMFPETPSVSIVHEGPYGTQSADYMKLFSYCSTKGYTVITPIIERYSKGPGMIIKGNPDKYQTELIVLVKK